MDTQQSGQPGDDLELAPMKSRPPRWPWLLLALVAVGGAGFQGYRFWQSRQAVQPPPPPAPAAPVEAARLPEPPPLPPVAQADGMVREKLGGASANGLWEKWLQNDDLARRFASAVNAVADGESPRLVLGFLAPEGAFKVVGDKKSGKSFIDPASFQRYDAVADAFASIDTAFAARAYGTLSPVFEAAYREIGRPSTTLEQRLASAMGRLLATPVPEGRVEVVAPKVVWLYADPKLEGLCAASKHLLRMGPRNERLVQAKLAELQAALKLPKPAP